MTTGKYWVEDYWLDVSNKNGMKLLSYNWVYLYYTQPFKKRAVIMFFFLFIAFGKDSRLSSYPYPP